MTVESHRIYETSVVNNGGRRIAHTNRRRLISAPPGGGGGKPIAAHVVKIGSFTEKPVRRLASTNGGGMAPLGAFRSSIANGGGGPVELSKMVIVKRLASSASPPASAPSKRGSIALQSGTLRESPSAESPCEQQNRFVDSPHGSLTHSEVLFPAFPILSLYFLLALFFFFLRIHITRPFIFAFSHWNLEIFFFILPLFCY